MSSLVKKQGVNSFEDIPGDHIFSVDLEKEDCSIVKNIAVEDWVRSGGLGVPLGKTKG